MNPELPLAGRLALVTGGAVRIGRAIAKLLAEAGADLAIHYRSSDDEARALKQEVESIGRRAVLVQADLSEPVAAATTIFDRLKGLGDLPDILINSAAIFTNATLVDTEENLYDRHLDINLKAPFFLCREFARHCPREKRGDIVNLIDWRAQRPTGEYIAYQLSKAGLSALTISLAQQLAPNIRVNGVAPGPILPPPGGDLSHFDDIIPKVPLRMHGDPEDIAEAVLSFLRSRFVTGEILHVTGGQHLQTP